MNKFRLISLVCAVSLMVSSGYILGKNIIQKAQADAKETSPRIHTLDEVLKDPILANAMHTNDNYDTLYGKVLKQGTKGDAYAEVWIQQGYDEEAKYKLFFHRDLNDPESIIERKNRGDKVEIIDRKTKKEEVTLAMPTMEVPEPKEPDTIYPNWNGTFVGTYVVDSLIHPESDIQSLFLRSTISKDGEAIILSRKATKYTINPQHKKPMVDTGKYEYYFDNETGILLKTVSYDGEKVKETIYFEELELNQPIDRTIFDF